MEISMSDVRLLQAIAEGWGWTGLKPSRVVASNKFGNVIVRDADGRYWRICPEELSCEAIAQDEQEFEKRRRDEEFQLDWEMERLVEIARAECGAPEEGRCYCLKLPGMLGGKYEAANMGTKALLETIGFSGEVARQFKDVPDGGKIEFKWTL